MAATEEGLSTDYADFTDLRISYQLRQEVDQMNDWIANMLGSATVTGIAILVINQYVVGRIKHEFDCRIEALKPLTAEETLRRENFLNAKRDAFYDAILVLSQFLEAVSWSGPNIPQDRPVQGKRPTEAVVNTCLAKISMFCDDPEIPNAFLKCFQNASPVSLGQFVNRLRQDLGYKELPFDPNEYKRFFSREPGQKMGEQ